MRVKQGAAVVGPDADVVSILETALDAARKGRIRSIALAHDLDSIDTATVWTTGPGHDAARLYFAVVKLKQEILRDG